VARGTIKSLTLDSIEYELEGRAITVAFGQDLEGGRGAIGLDDVAQWSTGVYSSPSGQTSTSSEPLTGDDAELLRRLMERRQQQLGQ
jgi:hypothetical protein